MCPRHDSMSVILGLMAMFGIATAQANVISVRGDSASIGQAVKAADVLTPGPGLHLPHEELGLSGDDELDAMSAGRDSITLADAIYYSVDRTSPGIPGTSVFHQSDRDQQAGDIYVTVDGLPISAQGAISTPAGDNTWLLDEAGDDPLVPGLGLGSGNDEDVDAYSRGAFDFLRESPGHEVTVYFSLADGAPSLAAAGASPSDILASAPDAVKGSGSFFVLKDGELDIGLQNGDDIDGLALLILGDVHRAYFSLSKPSPSLDGPDGQPGTADDLSAADVFYTEFDGSYQRAYDALSLGLRLTDNVDALASSAVSPIPEPASVVTLGALSCALWARRSRRRSGSMARPHGQRRTS